MREIVNLLNEVGMLSNTPRSGFAFLGSGKQSVAEHSYRMAIVAFALAELVGKEIDKLKLLLMCLVHDLPEARTGDHNYVNKRYVKTDLEKIIKEIEQSSLLGPQIASCLNEYEKHSSLESQIAHDADQLELLLVLKELLDKGNPRAMDWWSVCIKRLKLPQSQQMAEEILKTPFDAWWIKDKNDSHWIHGSKDLK